MVGIELERVEYAALVSLIDDIDGSHRLYLNLRKGESYNDVKESHVRMRINALGELVRKGVVECEVLELNSGAIRHTWTPSRAGYYILVRTGVLDETDIAQE